MKPMKLKNGSIKEIDHYIEDPNWVLEQKMDGTRGLVHITANDSRWYSGSGGELKFAAAAQHLPLIVEQLRKALYVDETDETLDVWFDGEVMIDTGEFRIFDMPEATTNGLRHTQPNQTYAARRYAITLIMDYTDSPLIREVAIAIDSKQKRRLFNRVMESGGEGVVVKRHDAPYEPGKRPDHSVKLKFTKTADVVVMENSRRRNAAGREIGNYKFGVYQHGELVPLGSCSLIGKPDVGVGSVIEVTYLYWTGKKMIQPRMSRVREDKPASDCNFDQFPDYSREAV